MLRAPLAAVLALGLGIAIAVHPAFAHGPGGHSATAAGQVVSQHVRARVEQLTLDLTKLNLQHRLAGPGHRAQVEQAMLTTAKTREQELLAIIDSAPGDVLRVAIPARMRATLPAAVQTHVEEDGDVEGTLEVIHEHGPNDESWYRYSLDTRIGRLSLHFDRTEPDDLQSGHRVRVRGVRVGQALAAGGSGSGSVQVLAAALPNTFGTQSTLVILVNFTDRTTEPYTVDQARSMTFDTVSPWYDENSYGQTRLAGTVVGWFTIPLSYTVCDYYKLRDLARQAAASAGVNVSAYSRHVFGFPSNACSWAGLGTVGGNPSSAWIKGSYSLRVVAHELGHNFGLYHSHSLKCGTEVLGDTCTMSEYGDTVDVMGGSSNHFNPFQKERLGWLNYGSSPPLATVTSPGTFTLSPYALPGPLNALKVLKSVDPGTGRRTHYYAEFRHATGYDASLTTNVRSGVVVRLGTESSPDSSYLLDMTPETSSMSDPALTVNRTYYDPDSGVTLTPLWADGLAGAALQVAFGPIQCTRANPTVTVTPSQSQWVAAGTSVSYVLKITNNDNSGCAPVSFNVGANVPSGWTVAVNPSVVSVAPGSNASATVTVASPVTTSGGFYTIVMAATDAAAPSHGASTNATYVVASTLDVAVSTNKSLYAPGEAVAVTTTVQANGAAVAGASVAVTFTRPNGSKSTLNATTNASGVASVVLQLKKQDPTGTWQVGSSATLSGAAASGQGSATFTVQGSTGGGKGGGKK